MSRVPNPDEARRLARLRFDRPPAEEAPSMTSAIDWPKSWTPDVIAWVIRQIIGEYRRKAASAAPPEPPRPDLDADQIARIIAAAEGFPGNPSVKNRAIADRIASDYRGVAAPEGLDRVSLAAAIQSAGLPMHYVHKIMDEYARLSESGSPPPWRDDSDACPTCAHRPHDPGKCKARYRVTLAEDEEGDPCLCGALASLVRGESGSPTPPHDPNHPAYLCEVPDCPRYVGALDNYAAPTPPGEERP